MPKLRVYWKNGEIIFFLECFFFPYTLDHHHHLRSSVCCGKKERETLAYFFFSSLFFFIIIIFSFLYLFFSLQLYFIFIRRIECDKVIFYVERKRKFFPDRSIIIIVRRDLCVKVSGFIFLSLHGGKCPIVVVWIASHLLFSFRTIGKFNFHNFTL